MENSIIDAKHTAALIEKYLPQADQLKLTNQLGSPTSQSLPDNHLLLLHEAYWMAYNLAISDKHISHDERLILTRIRNDYSQITHSPQAANKRHFFLNQVWRQYSYILTSKKDKDYRQSALPTPFPTPKPSPYDSGGY